jgi:hypothetical protein
VSARQAPPFATPPILITSGEHYGTVLNLDFDYRKICHIAMPDSCHMARHGNHLVIASEPHTAQKKEKKSRKRITRQRPMALAFAVVG